MTKVVDTKPLIRWTIGPSSKDGFKCLEKSVSNIKKLYPECDFIVCHNQLSGAQKDKIANLDVDLFDQDKHQNSLNHPPQGVNVHWKLYPPRLRYNAHEICIDNDIILWKRVPEIDYFLNNNMCLIYQGKNRLYGIYDSNMPQAIRINSGIYGLPPAFDFGGKINDIQKPWKGRFDEQGLVATILSENPHFIIPLTSVPICEYWMTSDNFKKSLDSFLRNELCCGLHLVGINYSKQSHLYSSFIKNLWRSRIKMI